MGSVTETALDPMLAAVDLVGRSGARDFEVGYLHDDVPIADADWWASAHYAGTKIIEEHHVGPVEAANALAVRLLTGAKCTRCGGLVTLSDDGAFAWTEATLIDGTPWTAADALVAAATHGQCRWRRVGPKWIMGCERRPGR